MVDKARTVTCFVAVRMKTLLAAVAGEASDISFRLFLPRSLHCHRVHRA
jgi:hypothetical protein